MNGRFLRTTAPTPDRAQCRAADAGELVRVRSGVFLDSSCWEGLDARWRHIALVTAALERLQPHVVTSHASAAALWGFPVLDSWPAIVHVIDRSRSVGQRSSTLVRHPGQGALRDDDVARRHGLRCTSATRTAVDVALLDGFLSGLLCFDHGLRRGLFSHEEVEAALMRRGSARGIRAARQALAIAGPGSGSAGESISKGVAFELGFPLAEQQKSFPNPWGGEYFVDFWWEDFGIVGEFDGDQKYLDEAMRSGRTIEQVMLDEKRRADDILARPEVRNLVRWKYAAARNPRVLSRILHGSGLTQRR
ncbi:hypothetical protein AX769_11575 [Frondihabitans sp. PAMC 28766]|uniref:hypothetical protein n=1 Tax=Frondihabitans sp. PAMC 28766 TaxID=1795630 RepID=UPI00078CBE48|nr:hypothetical protein [Frondihabitans sp. PAMC 28766]AMM20664.1 hypothetical protein AX769_11575 [Frondihabitans sp. PAMC 28766]